MLKNAKKKKQSVTDEPTRWLLGRGARDKKAMIKQKQKTYYHYEKISALWTPCLMFPINNFSSFMQAIGIFGSGFSG